METVGDLLDHAAVRAESSALLAPNREPHSYADLLRFVSGVAGGLRSSGIAPDDRVALLVENGPEAASAFLAIASAAAVAPLNPSYGAQELAFFLEDIGARAAVVSTTLDTPARELAAELRIPLFDLRVETVAPAGTFVLDGLESGACLTTRPNPDDIALVLHTSGTTSRPKLVPLTHRQLCVSAGNVAQTLRLTPPDRCLNVMPLFHIHGLVTALLGSLYAGGSVACSPGFHQHRFFDWLDELNPTWYTAVPSMHAAVLRRARDRRETVARHRLRLVRSSSAALPVSVLDGLEATFRVPVIQAYGMTEAAHQVASNPVPPGVRKPGTVGPAAGPEVCVLDASGAALPPGDVGEVAIRGDNVFSGYEANDEANEAAFSAGWFRTGDEGVIDENGYLTLRGRIKEIINRGGEKISPLEVDDVLMAHEAVSQAVTFAMDDPRLGEEVAAAVVLAAGFCVDERDLQDFVATRLAPFKVPRRIVVVDDLPKGPSGKIQRIGLAERLGVAVDEVASRDVGRRPYRFLEPQLIAIWESVLDLPNVDVADDFFALGGDSILAAEAVAQVRDLVGNPDLSLISIVRAPTPAAMASEVMSWVGIGSSGAVPFQTEGTRVPLFLVHPGDGELLSYPALASRLGSDQPSYGLRARGLDGDEEMPSTLPEIASDYLAEVRRIQPRGPYVLGGFCVGGAIACEMAAQLHAGGEEVRLLVLLDPRFRRPRGIRAGLWRISRAARERRVVRAIGRRFEHKRATAPTSVDVWSALEHIRESYTPRPVAAPAVVFLSREYERFALPAWYLKRIVRHPRSWEKLCCEHAQLLLPPAVDVVARAIGEALAQA